MRRGNSVFWYETADFFTHLLISLLALPGTEFCSWSTTGVPVNSPATDPGTAAKPPKDSMTLGLDSLTYR